jgi:hypothetical protein
VIVDVTSDYVSGDVKGADDALEARWVSTAEIRELPVTKTTLKLLTQIGFISMPESPDVTENGDKFLFLKGK